MYLKETAAKKKLETADLNKFFTCVFNAENNFETIPTSANQTVNRNEFNDNSIFFCLQNLKSIKLTGPDGFGNYVLANAARSLLKTVKLIFSTTFNKGTIPEQWKPSQVTPIHKNGDKRNFEKYRPISLLYNISKAIEKVLFEELYSSINADVHHRQFSFRKHRSAGTQILIYLNKMYTLHHRTEITTLASLYTDFSEALDKVPHGPPIEKLRE